MEEKKFQRKKEDFICEVCSSYVYGNGYTNHCPYCLYSKHVDVSPGDRQSDCKGIMKPVSFEFKADNWRVIHCCIKCNHTKINKLSSQDNIDVIANLIEQNIQG